MEKKKCSFQEHTDIDAINYCQECKIYMCNKCENYHSKLFKNHHQYELNKDINEIFNNICHEENHSQKLEYFCKDHNILCCASCLCKIKNKGNGQHKDCNVCNIEDIKDEKINKLQENMKYLDELSLTLEQSINELKKFFEEINENKENLKQNIQKIFTNIRNVLNEREDKILFELDELFNKVYFKEDLIREGEKLPNKIKISLEKGNIIIKYLEDLKDNNKLNLIINACINIENNIKEINIINENIKKCNLNKKICIKFGPENELINNCINIENNIKEINVINENIRKFNINKNIKFKFIPRYRN